MLIEQSVAPATFNQNEYNTAFNVRAASHALESPLEQLDRRTGTDLRRYRNPNLILKHVHQLF
jgi:hypothetical protein